MTTVDRKSVFINIGRSNVASEASLTKALDSGWLGGAVLDVFDEEPLPPGHPFWKRKDVVVTPHVAAVSRPSEIAECLKDNIDSYLKGKQLNNLVKWEERY